MTKKIKNHCFHKLAAFFGTKKKMNQIRVVKLKLEQSNKRYIEKMKLQPRNT